MSIFKNCIPTDCAKKEKKIGYFDNKRVVPAINFVSNHVYNKEILKIN
jgi:hypothetical protein